MTSTESTSYGYPNNGSCGNSSLFTYYSEFYRSWNGAGTTEAAILVFVCVASLTTNAVVIYCAIRHPSLRTTTNYMVVNLAVADAVFALTAPPVAAVRLHHDWTFEDWICKLLPLSQLLCGAVLLWTLTVISVERYRCIVSHPHKPHFTSRGTLVVVVALWLVPLCVCAPLASYFEVVKVTVDGGAHSICTLCYPQGGRFRLAGVFLAFLIIGLAILPASIMIFNYYNILRRLKTTNNFSVSLKIRSKSRRTSVVVVAEEDEEQEEEEKEEREEEEEKEEEVKVEEGDKKEEEDDVGEMLTKRLSKGPELTKGPEVTKVRVCRQCSQFILDNGGSSSLDITSEMQQRCCYTAIKKDNIQEEEEAEEAEAAVDGQSATNFKIRRGKRTSGRIFALMKHRHNRRVILILIVDVLAVFLMWTPILAILVAIYVDSAEGADKSIKSHDFIYCLTVAYANSWLNAILYGVLNGNFRQYICHR